MNLFIATNRKRSSAYGKSAKSTTMMLESSPIRLIEKKWKCENSLDGSGKTQTDGQNEAGYMAKRITDQSINTLN